ncbi:MAG: hypothetical protein QOI51_38 [Nocardioidaceae bacterium]|jgi:signal transduction histidine kinase|nr:hypothetical protein [Nocardioidaceae bacterium]MDX6307393.1 hypothetical protein [Nocardioidaceae bacterium]
MTVSTSAPVSSRLPVAIRRPVVVDVGVVVATLAFALANDRFGDQARLGAVAGVFDVALCVPLFWRRRWPLGCFLVVAALALVQWAVDTPASGPVAVLVALYAVGAYESRRWAIVAATAIALLGVVMSVLRWAPTNHRATLAALLAGTVTAAWMTGVYARTRRAYLTSVLDRAATAERERDQQTLLATAAERGRISREMHDIVAHTLSVMVALSDGAAMSVERDANAAGEAMQQSSALGRRALADLRRLLGGLDEPDGAVRAPTPGLNQVDALVGSVRAAGLPVELAMTGQPADVPPGLQLAVYRLVQESLTNVLKHAPTATRAVVTLSFGVSTVDLDVVNDGHARTVAAESGRSVGQGLTGMRERAAVFGGAVDAGPTPLGGWRVATRLTFGEDANLS